MSALRAFRVRAVHLVWCASLASLGLGLLADQLSYLPFALLTLVPAFSHTRWVGFRNALSEPSAATVILVFYMFVFPLRGLVIAAAGYRDVQFDPFPLTPSDLVAELAIASLATTGILEAFHRVRQAERRRIGTRPRNRDAPSAQMAVDGRGLVTLAIVLSGGALLGLLLMLVQYHGLGGVQDQFLSHSKVAGGNKSSTYRLWGVLAVPAVWCLAAAVVRAPRSRTERIVMASTAGIIVAAQIVAFGARLDALLSLLGVWAVMYYSGFRLPPLAVIMGIVVLIGLSIPILSERPGGNGPTTRPLYERLSEITSYGILDAALTVNQNPGQIEAEMSAARRWLDSPLYLVPSFVWPNKPTINGKTMDVYVAKTIGNSQQQDTGFPTSYITEQLLYGGWALVLVISVMFGALLGWMHVRLLERWPHPIPPAALIWQSFVLDAAFTYYKDGDVLQTVLGELRTAFYLGIAMTVTGVWSLRNVSGLVGTRSAARVPVVTQGGHQARSSRATRP